MITKINEFITKPLKESNASKVANYYLDSNDTNAIFEYIFESYVNGQMKQCRQIYNELDSDAKQEFENFVVQQADQCEDGGTYYNNLSSMWRMLTGKGLAADDEDYLESKTTNEGGDEKPLYHDIDFVSLKKDYIKFNPEDKSFKIFNWFKRKVKSYKVLD